MRSAPTATFEKEIAELTIVSSGGRTGKVSVAVYAEERGAVVALYAAWGEFGGGMGMHPDQAEELAAALVKGAREAKKLRTEGGFTVKFEPKRAAK